MSTYWCASPTPHSHHMTNDIAPAQTKLLQPSPTPSLNLYGYIAERRATPSDDLISYLATMEVDIGRLLNDEEILVNCLSLLLGAVVTTSQVINATFIAPFAEMNNGEGQSPPPWSRPPQLRKHCAGHVR